LRCTSADLHGQGCCAYPVVRRLLAVRTAPAIPLLTVVNAVAYDVTCEPLSRDDDESGLYYLRARYYDPTTAQFLTRAPTVSKTRSPYVYVAGNPLNATDPRGLCDWYAVVVCGVQGAAGVVSSVAGAVGDALPNCTVFDGDCAPVIKSASICGNASIFGGIGLMGSACFGETNGYSHGGFTFSGGPGVGLGASASGGIAISNANCPQDYAGPLIEGGGGYGIASATGQTSPDGKTRVGYLGVGPSTPQGYAGANKTAVWQLW
jgi:RHS repeat-associated protein